MQTFDALNYVTESVDNVDDTILPRCLAETWICRKKIKRSYFV